MDLPPHCLGHIGYAVVPWKRRLGYATSALAQMLVIARERGMSYVDIVTDVDNVPSQAVVLANGACSCASSPCPSHRAASLPCCSGCHVTWVFLRFAETRAPSR
jgi:hypothetical protein